MINSSITSLVCLAACSIHFGVFAAQPPDEAAQAAFSACRQRAEAASQADRSNGRRFSQYAYGQDLCQMLLESDQDVDVAVAEFLEIGRPPGVKPSYPDPYLVQIARGADTIVVGRLVSRSTHFTPSRSFLFSEFEMEVEEIVKGPAAATGGLITVLRPGGAFKFGNRRIRAVSSRFKPFQVGGRYILFLSVVPETGAYVATAETSFQSLPAGGVAKLTTSPDVDLAKSRGDLEGFLREVRDAVRSTQN